MLYNPVSYILQSPEMTWYDFTTNSYVVSTYSHYIASALTAVPSFVPALDEELGQHILQLCELFFLQTLQLAATTILKMIQTMAKVTGLCQGPLFWGVLLCSIHLQAWSCGLSEHLLLECNREAAVVPSSTALLKRMPTCEFADCSVTQSKTR